MSLLILFAGASSTPVEITATFSAVLNKPDRFELKKPARVNLNKPDRVKLEKET